MAKLRKSREKNIATIIIAEESAVIFANMLAVLMKMPPASLNVGKDAKTGIRKAIIKEREKTRISFILCAYVSIAYDKTFVILTPQHFNAIAKTIANRKEKDKRLFIYVDEQDTVLPVIAFITQGAATAIETPITPPMSMPIA